MEFERPIDGVETEAASAPSAAVTTAVEAALHGDLAQMFTPPIFRGVTRLNPLTPVLPLPIPGG